MPAFQVQDFVTYVQGVAIGGLGGSDFYTLIVWREQLLYHDPWLHAFTMMWRDVPRICYLACMRFEEARNIFTGCLQLPTLMILHHV